MITPLDIFSLESWLLICSIIFLVRWYIHRSWSVLKKLNIPHNPPSLSKLGNLGEFLKDPDLMFTIDAELMKKYGRVYGSYSWLSPRICVADPNIIKQIFIKEAETFKDRQRTFSRINGKEMNTALTWASGNQWKRIRNTITPTFSSSKLKDMFVIVDQCTDKMIESLQKKYEKENGRFNLKDTCGQLSMDVICSCAFGVDVHSQSETGNELVERSKKVFSQKFFGPLRLLFVMWPLLENIAELCNYSAFDRDLVSYYKRLIDTVIRQKKEAKDKMRADILQGMLASEISEEDVKNGATKGLTRTEIVGNSIIMLIAGYETTATALTFFVYCAAAQAEVQEKLLKEILEARQEHNGLTYEAVNSMKYMDMCFKESLRLYGAVPRNSRYTDVDITVNGITIPAGTHVGVPTYALHHDEKFWHDPWKFIPERFEDMSKIDPMVYQPFGVGPRNCIGMRLAIIEVKMAIAKLLLNFKLDMCDDTPSPPLKVTFRSSMQPKEDVHLRVFPRN